MKRILTFILIPILLIGIEACSDDVEKVTAIAPVSNISYEAGNGTLLFRWDKPLSNDLAYTEISYVNDNGKERKVLVDEKITEQLVRGFGSSKSYEFKFITYNREGVASEPVSFFASPLEPLMNIFNGKVKTTVDFGGIYLSWDNIYDEDFYIDLEYSDINGNDYKEEVLASAKSSGEKFIAVASKLEGTQTINVSSYISDTYGNQSAPYIFQFYKLEAGKFDRSLWEVLDFSSQLNDSQYKVANVLDCKTSTFWHSKWTGEYTYPHHATFDLKSKKRIEKAEFQQRQDNKMTKDIEIWGSNDYTTADGTVWTFCGTCTLENSNDMQLFVLPNPIEYRYIRLILTTPMTTGGTSGGLAEFALYGQDLAQ